MEFNSQICTTKEQSERLLALGLKKETADMKYPCITEYYGGILTEGMSSLPMIINTEDDEVTEYDFPAWSLHRLIEMCNKSQSQLMIAIYNDEVYLNTEVFEVYDNAFDNLISVIEKLIKNNIFNKYVNLKM